MALRLSNYIIAMALSVRDKILAYLKAKHKDVYNEDEIERLADEIYEFTEIIINLYEQDKQ